MKGTWWKIILAILLAAALAVAGFFVGAAVERKKAQREYDIGVTLARSDLEGLGEIEGKIYVTGHKSPDTDTVCGAIAYARLLRKLGYDAEAAVLGQINNETAFVLRKAGVAVPEVLESAAGEQIVLIDHSDYAQSADGLEDAKILMIIDHHNAGTVATGNQLIYDSRPIGAAATVVWMRYRAYGVEMDKDVAELLMAAILSDTSNLSSPTHTAADSIAVTKCAELAGVTDVNAYYREMYKALISYEGFTDEEIFLSDWKEYESAGRHFAIGVVNAYDEAAALDLAARMKAVIPGTLASTGVEMAFAQVSIFHDDLDVNYLVPSDERAAEVLATAFPEARFDGTSYILEPGVSRKKVIVPAVSDVLAQFPQE